MNFKFSIKNNSLSINHNYKHKYNFYKIKITKFKIIKIYCMKIYKM